MSDETDSWFKPLGLDVGSIVGAVSDAASSAVNTVSSAASSVADAAGSAYDSAASAVSSAYDSASSAASSAYDAASGAASSAYDAASGAASSAYDAASGAASGAYDAAASAGSTALDLGNTAGKAIMDAESGAWDSAKGAYNAVTGAYDSVAPNFTQANKDLGSLVDMAEKAVHDGNAKMVAEYGDVPVLGSIAKASSWLSDATTTATGGVVKGVGDLAAMGGNAIFHPIDATVGLAEGALGIAENVPLVPGLNTTVKGIHGLVDIASGKEDGQYGKTVGDLAENLLMNTHKDPESDDPNKKSDTTVDFLASIGGGKKAWTEKPFEAATRTVTNLLPMLLGDEAAGAKPVPEGPPIPKGLPAEPPISPAAQSVRPPGIPEGPIHAPVRGGPRFPVGPEPPSVVPSTIPGEPPTIRTGPPEPFDPSPSFKGGPNTEVTPSGPFDPSPSFKGGPNTEISPSGPFEPSPSFKDGPNTQVSPSRPKVPVDPIVENPVVGPKTEVEPAKPPADPEVLKANVEQARTNFADAEAAQKITDKASSEATTAHVRYRSKSMPNSPEFDPQNWDPDVDIDLAEKAQIASDANAAALRELSAARKVLKQAQEAAPKAKGKGGGGSLFGPPKK